jgi:predicted DNA-binding transcriptional regulator AlpA
MKISNTKKNLNYGSPKSQDESPNYLTIEKLKHNILKSYGERERLVREAERKSITTLSRSRTTQLEKEGKHPKRIKLGGNSCAWVLSEILLFINRKPINWEDQ